MAFSDNGNELIFCFDLLDEGTKERFTVLTQLDHAGKDINILIGLTSRNTTLALDLHDEQLRMHLHEDTFALNDLRAAHIRTNAELLADEIA